MMEQQHNAQKKKDTRINNDLQNTTKKNKDRVSPNKLMVNSGAP